MKIILSNSSSKWGGVHTVTEILAKGLRGRGHDVTVFGYPGGMLEQRMEGVVPFEPILKGMDLHPVTLARVMAALRRRRAEVVLAMMKKDVRLTVPAARALGIPSVVRHANDRPLTGWVYDRFFFGALPDHHIVNSAATRATLLTSAPWINADRVTVVYNGIELERFETADPVDLGVAPGAFVFGFIGRLETRKGLLDLAAAWKQVAAELADAWLVIVGKGPDENRAREILGETERVRWLGYREDVAALLASMNALVVPSHWEGFGLVAAEGLAAGVPVIAARASSLPEIIEDGVTGRLVPPRNPKSLAQAMKQIAVNAHERSRTVAAGKEKVRAEFSVSAMVERYERVLTQVGKTS